MRVTWVWIQTYTGSGQLPVGPLVYARENPWDEQDRFSLRRYYLMVNFATASSLNGFSTCKLSLQKLNNIIYKWKKYYIYFITLIIYNRAVVQQNHSLYDSLLLSFSNTNPWCSHWKIHRYVAAPSLYCLHILWDGWFSLYKYKW